MTLVTEIEILLAFGVGMFLVFIVGRLFAKPLKMLLKLIKNSILGGCFIIIFNLVGNLLGLSIPLNIINAFIVGILGLPGAVGLVLLFLAN